MENKWVVESKHDVVIVCIALTVGLERMQRRKEKELSKD